MDIHKWDGKGKEGEKQQRLGIRFEPSVRPPYSVPRKICNKK